MIRKTGILLFIILISGAVVFWLRFFGAEDSWICQNNEWIKHGNPNSQKPLTGCGESSINIIEKQSLPSTSSQNFRPIAKPLASAPGPISLTGLYVCLPALSSGPQTMECALGLMTDDKNYYALNTNKLKSYIMFPTGTQLRVFGEFMPIELDSSMISKKYNVKGIIYLDKVEEVE